MRMVISMKELRYLGEQFVQGNLDEIVWECERELEKTEWEIEIEIEGAENIFHHFGVGVLV